MRTMVAGAALSIPLASVLVFGIAASPPSGGSANLAALLPATGGATLEGEAADYEYVGSDKCKMCHMTAHRSWAKTKMGMAFDTLKPGASADVKKAYGLDPNKDYTTDETCLKCHTTGFGHDGGYFVPDASDAKAVRKAKKLRGVGCESCHGPGGEYIDLHMQLLMSKRKYKVEEMYALGMTKVDASVCVTCHNEDGPTVSKSDPFDFEAKKNEDTHERIPLKQRE